MQFIIFTAMPGYLSESDMEPFEATVDEAITALIDEADFQLGEDFDESDEAAVSDHAYVESLRGHEGRGDLAMELDMRGTASIPLESYANGFGGTVTLALYIPE